MIPHLKPHNTHVGCHLQGLEMRRRRPMRPLSVVLSILFLASTAVDAGEASSGKLRGKRRRVRAGVVLNSHSKFPASAVALQGGVEFDDPNSYQTKALEYVVSDRGLAADDADFLPLYALACIYYASSGVYNMWTLQDFPTLSDLPGWVTSTHWLTDRDKCDWHGVTCDSTGSVIALELFGNRMLGHFAPEVQFLAPSLQKIDLSDNPYLCAEGDGGHYWIGEMSNLRQLYLSKTAFEYHGIPTFFNHLPLLGKFAIGHTASQWTA